MVGELQFDVLRTRLNDEYNVETTLQHLSYKMAMWLSSDEKLPDNVHHVGTSIQVQDTHGNRAILFSDKWELDFLLKNSAGLHLSETPP